MEAVVLILALLFIAFVALGVYVTVKAVRAAKRGVERTVTQARRTVEDTALRAKSYGQGGVTAELAQLRLKLRTSMRATQDALQAGVTEDASLSESLGLFQRLSAHGHELDDELRRLEREPDRATTASLLPGLRERTERITASAESLRWAARDRARKFADDDLDSLSAQIDVEAGALRHWSSATPSHTSPSAADRPTAAADWPEAGPAAADGVPAEQTWPETGAEQGAGPAADAAAGAGAGPGSTIADQPPAITGRDPRQQASYPWEKTSRPETTT
ncbi:hypothetical protein QCN29_21150 [Streptomyces sp. HNM0663]|uniref:Secreted protein n=1 Tax=Streptomyces chengmaiensis TaxID=3040919 RepID=A0ABT6HR98_9ACTN|nr:hypothetical protein [Streptomyces chengmaiensis]MDH2391243.1 hypothetical protein [Streptomyces chengmaiensis]